jgi:hypothetical protein
MGEEEISQRTGTVYRLNSPAVAQEREQSAQFGSIPGDILATAWFVAFIPVIAVFLIWLLAFGGLRSNGQPPNFDSQPGGGFYPSYGTTYTGDTGYPATDEPTSTTGDALSQAQTIEQVLQQTAADRTAAANAVSDIADCGASSGLQTDINTLDSTQSNRTSLVSQLENAPVDQLSGGAQAVQFLEAALQDSATSDNDYAQAGEDFADDPSSCTAGAMAQDSNFVAGQNEDQTATTDKTSFTDAWNPIAQQYGLATWDQSQF